MQLNFRVLGTHFFLIERSDTKLSHFFAPCTPNAPILASSTPNDPTKFVTIAPTFESRQAQVRHFHIMSGAPPPHGGDRKENVGLGVGD